MEAFLSDPAKESDIDEFLNVAKADGQKDAFLRFLVDVRSAHSHDGVSIGHLVWIRMLLDKEIPENAPMPAPRFARRDHSLLSFKEEKKWRKTFPRT